MPNLLATWTSLPLLNSPCPPAAMQDGNSETDKGSILLRGTLSEYSGLRSTYFAILALIATHFYICAEGVMRCDNSR